MNAIKEKIEENWEKILYSIQLEHGVAPITINTWIRPLKIYDVKDHTIYLLADDTLGQRGIEFLKTKMYDMFIKASIQIVMNEDYDPRMKLHRKLLRLLLPTIIWNIIWKQVI